MSPRLVSIAIGSAIFASSAFAGSPKPDLTAAGAIAALKANPGTLRPYKETYNLGATGLRGWIYIDPDDVGQQGLITDRSYQILVTAAAAPGNTVLAVDDVILGAMAGSTGTVPNFSTDCRKAFGLAIGAAESLGQGSLRVKRWRAGTTSEVNIPMTIMGNYAATAPFNCPKSNLIFENARNKLIADTTYLDGYFNRAIDALALLASVPSTNTAVQTRLRNYARELAPATLNLTNCETWHYGYVGLFLSEYYLQSVANGTPDTSVLHGINQYALIMSKAQSRYGTYASSGLNLKPDGSLHGTVPPYGPLNAAGIPVVAAVVLAKKALLAGGRTIDPEIDQAIKRGTDFFTFYVNKGPIPYGEQEPYIDEKSSGHASNGKDAMCAVMFGLQDNCQRQTEFFTRMTTAGYTGREYGHTGQGFSFLWGALGANIGGDLAVTEYLKKLRWHFDLLRRTDGSFTYEGQEQYGGGTPIGDPYLGTTGYNGMNPTATYVLSYAVSLKKLYITGKKDVGATDYTLDPVKVSHAIAAATYKLDCPNYSVAQLKAALGDYDPVVRNDAARELAGRPLSSTEINSLIAMITNATLNPDANIRMGVCQTLSMRLPPMGAPALRERLSDPDLWVRAQAARGLTRHKAGARDQLDSMLTAYAANATDPEQIVWEDPIQISNGYLSTALFNGPGNPELLAYYTKSAAKPLLYEAVRAGLAQPDSNTREGSSKFARDALSFEDIKALTPELITVTTSSAQADTMWVGETRASGIETLAKFQAAETVPIALAMMTPPVNFGWGSQAYRLAGLEALSSFGDSARWTLPELRAYQAAWRGTPNLEPAVARAITAIETAITTPSGIINLEAVANSQLVVISTNTPRSVTLTGSSCRGTSLSYLTGVAPIHGTLSGNAPNLVYTPFGNHTGVDRFTFRVSDGLTTSESATVSIILGNAGTGLKGEYFDEMNFTNPRFTRTSAVNFDWGTGTPDPRLSPDTFSVRWGGLMLVPETGTYRFSTLSSEGVRLYINGVPMINSFSDQSTSWRDSASVNLVAGQFVDIHLNYYENTGAAVAKLKWTGPSFAGRNGVIIGQEWLFAEAAGTTRTPFAHANALTMTQNTSLPITLSGSGLDPRSTLVTTPSNGQLSGTPPNLIYTPSLNYSGVDSFTFKVTDGPLVSAVATVSIRVIRSNFAPVAEAQSINAVVGIPKPVLLRGTDVDDDVLTYRVTTAPTKGSLSGSFPNLSYTPNAGVTGADSFKFVVNDGLVDSTTATVAITISAPNAMPVALSQNVTTTQGLPKSITLSATDTDLGTLMYATDILPTHGTLTGTPPTVTYTPTAGYYGADSFTFKANDGVADSSPARVNITVTSTINTNNWINAAGGVWSLGSNWTASPTSSSTALLAFNVVGTYNANCDVATGFELNQLSFGGSTATLSGNDLTLRPNGSVTAQLIQNSNAAVAITAPVNFPAALEISGGGLGAISLNGKLTGSGGMAKTSAGVTTITGSGNSIDGVTSILSGSLIQNNGSVLSGGVTIDGGSMIITGSDTQWTPKYNSAGVIIGQQTGQNILTITNGAEFLPYHNRTTVIGSVVGSNNNRVTVSGSGSKFGDLTNATGLHLGSSRTISDTSAATGGNNNEIRVLAGASMVSNSSRTNRSIIGTNSSGNKITIDGVGSEWNICPGNLYLGYGGAQDINNGLVISNGGQVNMTRRRWIAESLEFYDLNPQFANIGNANQATGNYVTVTGAGSLWNLETGQINIGNGGIRKGDGGSIAGIGNSLTVSDGGKISNLTWLMIGNSTAAAYGNNVLVTKGGKIDFNSDGGIYVGAAAATENRLNVTAGGILQFRSRLPRIEIGSGSGNRVTFKNSTLSYRSVTDADMSANKTTGVGVGSFNWLGQNTYRLDDSSDIGDTPYIFANNLEASNFTTLEVLGTTAITRSITLDGLYGGSLHLASASATITGGINLVGPVAMTATLDNSALAGNVRGSGSLVKLGGAKLTLSNTPSYSGNTTVAAGILNFTKINVSNQDSTVTLPTTGAALELSFIGTDTMARLAIGGNLMPAGIYKSNTNSGPGTAIPQIIGTGTLTVLTQAPLPGSYQAWALAAAQGLTAGVNDGSTEDPDQDGISNLMEFALGGAPLVASRSILPLLTKTAGTWTLQFNRSDASVAAGSKQFFESCVNMKDWTSVEIPETSLGNIEIIPGTPSDVIKITLPNAAPQTFVRLKVSQ